MKDVFTAIIISTSFHSLNFMYVNDDFQGVDCKWMLMYALKAC